MTGSAHRSIAAAVAELDDELVAIRRDLHAHPEPSWEEHRSTAVLADRLEAAGLHPTIAPTGTGVLCDIGQGGPIVAIRGDIDALRMPDTKDVPYRSTVEGVCHACGHDLHATASLGAALALARLHRDHGLEGTVRLVLQPAEEAIPGGASALVAAGSLDGVQAVFGVHADPGRAAGTVGLAVGPITSAADLMVIRLKGPGGHTARPHETADLIHVAARVALELPAALGRLCDPRDGLNVTFGSIQAGSAPNVIPTEATLRGSLRASGRGAWDAAPTHLPRLLAGIVEPMGATWELEHQRGAPPVDNDAWAIDCATAAATAVLGAEGLGTTVQSAGGEDFAWYGEVAPLAYVRLGVARAGVARTDLHASAFDIDEAAIGIGTRLLAGCAVEALADLGHATS